jgi:TetR/AcrR family transcriptional regulator, cholesterol catabolism regulator
MARNPARPPAVRKARNAEILQAAAKVFRQKGFHAARIQDIADEVGMQKGSLYHYISTKEDLLHGLVEGALERMIEETRAILGTGHPAPQKLAMAIEIQLRQTQEHRDIWGVLQREDLDLLNRNSPTDIRKLMKDYEALWARILKEGSDAGEFDPSLDRRVVVQGLVGMCRAVYMWFKPDGRLPIQEVARILAEISLRGLQRQPEATPNG